MEVKGGVNSNRINIIHTSNHMAMFNHEYTLIYQQSRFN